MTKNLDCKTVYEMIDNMLTGVAFFSFCEDKMELLYMNDGGFRMLGYTPALGIKYINNMVSVILEEDKPKFWQAIEDVLKDDGAVDVEIRTVTAQGSMRWLQLRGNLYEKTAQQAVILCVFLDATDRKFVENELYIQSEWYQVLLETDEEMLFDYNARTDVLAIKRRSEYGIENTKIIDRYLAGLKENIPGTLAQNKIVETMDSALKIPRSDIIELKMSLSEGAPQRWYRIHTSSIAGVDGYVTHIVGKITDIHEKKRLLEELREKEKLDTLTGWYNAEETKRQVQKVLDASCENELHAFILVDMSRFRIVNEGLGEEKGNQVLLEVTKRIGKGFKRSDILGRFSSDELVIFVQNIGSVSNLDAVASRVARSTEITFGSGEDMITLSGCVGVSVYPYQGTSLQELFLRAEKAVNSLMASGKSGYHIHDLSGIYKKELAENEKLKTVYEENTKEENLEELIIQILCENKQNENLMRAMLKLIIRGFGFQKAFLSIEGIKGRPGLEFSYFNPGYEKKEEIDDETRWFAFLKRLDVLEEGMSVIHNYDPIPEELSSYMIRNQIHTLLIQPLMMQGNVSGVFLMGECTGKEWKLSRDEEKQLRRILQLVQMYILRYEREQLGYTTSESGIRVLDNFDSYVLGIDYDTYELCFANRKILEALPELRLGDYCYRTFAHLDRPCEMCLMKSLDRNNPSSNWSEERFSTALRSWLKMHASWLRNEEYSATCLVNCMDISEYFMGGGNALPQKRLTDF